MMRKVILFVGFVLSLTLLTGVSFATCSGSVDLDINKIERTPGESTFKVIATANRAGDCLNIAWNQEDLNKYLEGVSPDETTNKGVSGDIRILSQLDAFETILESKKLYEYNIYDKGWTMNYCNIENCDGWGYPTTKFAVRSLLLNCYCIYTENTPVATFGRFNGVKSSHGKAQVSISGLPQTVVSFGDRAETANIANKVKIEWRGDLLGGHWISDPDYQVYTSPAGKYHLVSESYEAKDIKIDANGKHDITIDYCLGENDNWEITGIENAQECITAYNQEIDRVLNDKLYDYASSSNMIKNAYFVGSKLIVEEVPYSSKFPQFVLTFDAEWAGVHWITGEPKVTCPTATNFVSGENKKVTFKVQNIDSVENAAFTLNLDCDGNVNTVLTENRISLEKSESREVTATLTKSSLNDEKALCTFKAYATKEQSKIDTCTFDILVKSTTLDCPPGKCCEGGSSYKPKSCSSGLVCCKSSGASVGECKTSCDSGDKQNLQESVTGNIVKSSNTGSSNMIFIVLLVLILAGGGFYYLKYVKTPPEEIVSSEEDDETSETKKFCENCGAIIEEEDSFCTGCGEKI